MPAAKLNLPTIEKGATYRHALIWKNSVGAVIDLTGCTARMQVREDFSANDFLVELSTENDRLIITPAAGRIDFYIDAEDTALLIGEGGLYDLEIQHGNGDVTRLCQGKLIFNDEVTR
jgi:hypothetical protein